jgi:hypothetical protein
MSKSKTLINSLMPLLLTSAQPLLTTAQIPVTSLYVIVERVAYERRGLQPKVITWSVGYYADEAASVNANVSAVQMAELPINFSQAVTPEQANAVPIFTYLEQLVTAQLTDLLGADVTIENVP